MKEAQEPTKLNFRAGRVITDHMLHEKMLYTMQYSSIALLGRWSASRYRRTCCAQRYETRHDTIPETDLNYTIYAL